MPYVEIICLANSRKHGGRCVAGLRTDGQGWVRPVTRGEEGTLLVRHFTLQNGTPAQVLDILKIEITAPRPMPHQPENWLIGPKAWTLIKRPPNADVIQFLKRHIASGPGLLGNETDRAAYAAFTRTPAAASLALIAPPSVEWHLHEGPRGNVQVRATFPLGRVRYDLAVTDPLWEQRFIKLPFGTHRFTQPDSNTPERYLLTISLGEPYNSFCYKLVAAVIPIPAAWQPHF